jgi:hypothetical protein
VGELEAGQSQSPARLQNRPRARRLAAVAGIVRDGGLQVSVRRGDDQAVDGIGADGTEEGFRARCPGGRTYVMSDKQNSELFLALFAGSGTVAIVCKMRLAIL